jgi:hypothetical protein
VKLPTGADIVFDLDPLSHEIDPSKSSFRTLAPKIEIKLAKSKKGIKWNQLEGQDDSVQALSSKDHFPTPLLVPFAPQPDDLFLF